MNASEKTTIIAHGLYRWAAVQNLPGSKVQRSPERDEWVKWANAYPKWVEFVKREQYNLFDRVNAEL